MVRKSAVEKFGFLQPLFWPCNRTHEFSDLIMTTVVDKLVPIRAIFSHLDDMKIKIKIHTLSFMSNLIWVIIFNFSFIFEFSVILD